MQPKSNSKTTTLPAGRRARHVEGMCSPALKKSRGTSTRVIRASTEESKEEFCVDPGTCDGHACACLPKGVPMLTTLERLVLFGEAMSSPCKFIVRGRSGSADAVCGGRMRASASLQGFHGDAAVWVECTDCRRPAPAAPWVAQLPIKAAPTNEPVVADEAEAGDAGVLEPDAVRAAPFVAIPTPPWQKFAEATARQQQEARGMGRMGLMLSIGAATTPNTSAKAVDSVVGMLGMRVPNKTVSPQIHFLACTRAASALVQQSIDHAITRARDDRLAKEAAAAEAAATEAAAAEAAAKAAAEARAARTYAEAAAPVPPVHPATLIMIAAAASLTATPQEHATEDVWGSGDCGWQSKQNSSHGVCCLVDADPRTTGNSAMMVIMMSRATSTHEIKRNISKFQKSAKKMDGAGMKASLELLYDAGAKVRFMCTDGDTEAHLVMQEFMLKVNGGEEGTDWKHCWGDDA